MESVTCTVGVILREMLSAGTVGMASGPGSLFSLVFGCGCASDARPGRDAGRLPTAKMAGSANAALEDSGAASGRAAGSVAG